MFTIAAGIILALFILGLLEDIPDYVWYWFWGLVVVFVVWYFGFLPDILTGLLVCIVILILGAGCNWLEEKIHCRKNNRKK